MNRSDVAELGTILSVWAHPDDETYLAAGVMAAARDLGQRVVCVCATDGERGTSDPEQWPPQRLAPLRRREFAAAMAVLGVREHEALGLPDGDLASHDARGTTLISQIVERVGPDTILTFGPDGATFHPDHIAVHRWVTEAWRRSRRRSQLLYAAVTTDHLRRFGALYEQWGVYMDTRRPVGVPGDQLALHIDLAGPALDRKLTALRCLESQTAAAMGLEGYVASVTEETFVAADPKNADAALTTPRGAVSAT
jgi:LmbE family N-acetylglucosaminyl deacetylase